MKEYQIWVGYYHLGQGYDPPSCPQLDATIKATTFQVACYIHELQGTLKSVIDQNEKGYVQLQSLHNWYDPNTMTNDWTGKYFQTEEEAWTSFPKHMRNESNS